MPDYFLTYFAAEKHESLIFVIVGVCAIIASVVVWRGDGNYRSMAYPLTAIALIQVVVGSTVYFRTDRQIEMLTRQYQEDPQHFQATETARMKTVNDSFKLYKYVEIALLLVGIVLTFAVSRSGAWYAVATGLIIQSSFMLVADLLAERRAYEYVARLVELLL